MRCNYFLLLITLFSLMLTGCSSLSPQTRYLLDEAIETRHKLIEGVENLTKDDGDCGPAALATVLAWSGREVSTAQLKPQMYTPLHNGSLPSDLISAARNFGMLAIEVSTMSSAVKELSGGNPVIALLNMGFSWLPVWHYVVLVGYDFGSQEFIMYTGKSHAEHMPFTYFERHWQLSNFWAVVVLPPDRLAHSASELSHMQAASGLEALGKLNSAKQAYAAILKKWQNSFTAHFGMGNIAYQERNYSLAADYLAKAIALKPTSKAAKHNLAIVRKELKSPPVH